MSDVPVCVKTPKGIEEVEKRAHGLPMRARQVLIMIDGRRDQATLSTMFAADTLPEILNKLLSEGFITPLNAPQPAASAGAAVPAKPSAPAPSNDYERYQMARNFMINTTNAFVGVAGSSLISRLESTGDIPGLRQEYEDWRNAMKLTSDGKKRLPELEGKLAALLS